VVVHRDDPGDAEDPQQRGVDAEARADVQDELRAFELAPDRLHFADVDVERHAVDVEVRVVGVEPLGELGADGGLVPTEDLSQSVERRGVHGVLAHSSTVRNGAIR
jgi:hypothetical protein